MKRYLCFAMFLLVAGGLQAQNMVLRSNYTYPFGLANIGGYVDGQGNEYALVGTDNGLSIVDVTDPDNPFEAFDVAGAQSGWREVKTWQTYAYVTNESAGGLQIIDLSNLPVSVTPKNYTGDGAISGQLSTIHALHIEDGICYLYGSNLFDGAGILLDIGTDPWNPVYLGHTPSNGSTTQSYIHDGYVRDDTLYAGYIYAGEVRIYDCTNKANPVLLATQVTPGQPERGWFEIQDLSSQRTGTFMEAGPDELWWDMCGGAGGKTLMLKSRVPDLNVFLTDRRDGILQSALRRFRKADIGGVTVLQADLDRDPVPHGFPDSFDGIILDAPCTGSGSWARSPERISAFSEQEISRYAALQRKLVDVASARLKPGGQLVYITCAVFAEENEQVAAHAEKTGLQSLKKILLNGFPERAECLFVAVMKKLSA